MNAARSPVVAIIPARGGSKGVPRKNLEQVGGRSLVERAVETCRRSTRIDAVYVSTDDAEIAGAALSAGAGVIDRPADLASDTASSEVALLHALDQLGSIDVAVGTLVFVQCTSPFIDSAALSEAVERVQSGAADSVFSAVETHDFLWVVGDGGEVRGVNHDETERQRRQDRTANWRETGAFYVMAADGFRERQHRFFGRIQVQPVDAWSAMEIDSPSELELARMLVRRESRRVPDVGHIDTVVMDFDGVHTNDLAYVDEHGTEMVVVSRRDGHGIKLLRRRGFHLLILSTETNAVVARRAEKLGIDCIQGVDEKWPALERWLEQRRISARQVAYVGNDVNDIGCMRRVGLPVAVADADRRVIETAAWITVERGGRGALRELAEVLLEKRLRESGGLDEESV